MKCIKCGKEYDFSGRLPFRARCESCDSALHVCVQCRFYDTSAYNSCRESRAERVVEKSRENRCEYFAPLEGEGSQKDSGEDHKRKFDDLFG